MPSSLLLALLAKSSPTERLIKNILNNPFAGIHQLAWFDWAMLIPYFTVLFILSIYGLHRYEIIHTYFKHRKKRVDEPAKRYDQLPPVTIQLPLYNERYVVERLIEETVKIEYPKELCRSRCWTIPPTTRRPSPKRSWSSIARSATLSSTITAAIATV